MAKGAAIGLAMIIPGVSGGTLAVLLKIYDKMIDAVGSLRKNFRQSFMFLLPIVSGIVIAFAAAYFPLKLALDHAPFPTMLLFAGLMAGSCPKLISDSRKNGLKKTDVTALILPFVLVVGLCFIPGLGNRNLGADMAWYQYVLVAIMGVLASCALVVPGISGSMLLMIFGYYQPILDLFGGILSSPAHCLALLALFAAGIAVGFFTIAKLMQFLLKKFPRATYWAICSFVLGSIPAVIITFFNKYKESLPQYLTPLHIALGVILFCLGAAATLAFTIYVGKAAKFKDGTKDCAKDGVKATEDGEKVGGEDCSEAAEDDAK